MGTFESKPWLNDTPQNAEKLMEVLNSNVELPDIPINPGGGGNIDPPSPEPI